jgi:hypothetical protein
MEVQGLGGFKNRVLRKNIWTNREKVRGDCRKLHNEEFNDFTLHEIIFGYLSLEEDKDG